MLRDASDRQQIASVSDRQQIASARRNKKLVRREPIKSFIFFTPPVSGGKVGGRRARAGLHPSIKDGWVGRNPKFQRVPESSKQRVAIRHLSIVPRRKNTCYLPHDASWEKAEDINISSKKSSS